MAGYDSGTARSAMPTGDWAEDAADPDELGPPRRAMRPGKEDPLELADVPKLWAPYIDCALLRAQLPSPFDYANRVLLAVPRDAPDPSGPAYQEYLQRFVTRALEISGGHALVLFTSNLLLQKTYEAVKPRFEEQGLSALRQTERNRLLVKFNHEITSVLFATESFWEGVGSPGETLYVVIQCRLPSKVPDEPLQLARSEAVAARGGNSFMALSVPEAVMKFRQGFGRLMRRQNDFGVILVPDNRLVTKSYGALFLASLPPVGRLFGSSRQVMDGLGDFLGRLRNGP